MLTKSSQFHHDVSLWHVTLNETFTVTLYWIMNAIGSVKTQIVMHHYGVKPLWPNDSLWLIIQTHFTPSQRILFMQTKSSQFHYDVSLWQHVTLNETFNVTLYWIMNAIGSVRTQVVMHQCDVKSLWPNDTLWRQKPRSPIVQPMVCHLWPSHYQNQYKNIVERTLWNIIYRLQNRNSNLVTYKYWFRKVFGTTLAILFSHQCIRASVGAAIAREIFDAAHSDCFTTRLVLCLP